MVQDTFMVQVLTASTFLSLGNETFCKLEHIVLFLDPTLTLGALSVVT